MEEEGGEEDRRVEGEGTRARRGRPLVVEEEEGEDCFRKVEAGFKGGRAEEGGKEEEEEEEEEEEAKSMP